MEIPVTVRPRFPGEGSSARGEPDPKVRPKGVADGQRVNIPVPLRWSDGVTQYARRAGYMPVQSRRMSGVKRPGVSLKADGTRSLRAEGIR